jgi:hypothetical protein
MRHLRRAEGGSERLHKLKNRPRLFPPSGPLIKKRRLNIMENQLAVQSVELTEYDLTPERWREYDFGGRQCLK